MKSSALRLLSRLAELEQSASKKATTAGVPPGYSGFVSALYCNASAGLQDLLSLFIELSDRFGGGEKMLPVRFNFLGKSSVLLTDPRHIHQVFNDAEHFSQSSHPQFMARFRDLLGFNLISVDHDVWKVVRSRTTAVLNGRPLAEYGDVMRSVMETSCLPFFERCAATQEPLDIFSSMLEFSSKVVFMAFMRLRAEEIPDNIHPALNRLFGHVRRHVLEPSFPLWVPSPANNEFKRDRDSVRDFIQPYIERQKTLDTMMGSIIRAHTRRIPGRSDARIPEYIASVFVGAEESGAQDLSRLSESVAKVLEARRDEPTYQLGRDLTRAANEWAKATKRALSIRQEQFEAALETLLCEGGEIDRELVLQEMVSNLIGGSETTILLMTWGLYFMSERPEVQEKLHREAAADTEHKVPLITPSTMKERWSYVYNVLRETLRLASPAAVFNRPVIADVTLDGFTLEKGTLVWGCQYITHRSPHVWSEPERFMPERFEQPIPAGAFFPFTLGPRMCVGMGYAYLEAAIALATIAKYFTFECRTRDVSHEMGLTFRPDRPVWVVLKKRACEHAISDA